MNIDNKIRKIPNWPKPDVLFYDLTTLFEDKDAFKYVVDEMCRPYGGVQIDKIVGIDARGFLLASSIAYKLGTGVSIVRKKGKLPYRTISRDYTLEYASETIEMHEDAIKPGERVLVVDDLVATGGTMKATVELVEQLGGVILGISWIVDLPFLGGSEKVRGYNCRYLVSYESEDVEDGIKAFPPEADQPWAEKHENIKTTDQVFPEPTVGALILNNKEEIFLMKSPKWENKYTIVGGHIELGETIEETLKREIKEETNLEVDIIKFLLHQECIFPHDFCKKGHFIFLDYLCRTNFPENVKLDNREGVEYAWMKPKEALERLNIHPMSRSTIEYYLKDKDRPEVTSAPSFISVPSKSNIKVGIIGGSGLENLDILQDKRQEKVNTPFGAPSDLVTMGSIKGVDVVIIPRHGRNHTIKPTDVNFRANIWAMKELGVTHILAATACGSLKEEIKPGDFVILNQFIDRTTKRAQTLYEGRVCHIPMAEPFCAKLGTLVYQTTQELGISAHPKGTAVTIEGPRFSTKAESHLFRSWNADVVNMTTVPEAVLAREAGICYQAIAMATDYDCWRDIGESVDIQKVLEVMKQNAEKMEKLLMEVISKIDFVECGCGEAVKTAVI